MEDNNRPYYANLTVSFRYVKDLPKIAQSYNVFLDLPIAISPDVTEANFTVFGSQENIMKFVQKFQNDRQRETQTIIDARKEDERHEGPITKHDVIDIKILVNTCKTIDELLNQM